MLTLLFRCNASSAEQERDKRRSLSYRQRGTCGGRARRKVLRDTGRQTGRETPRDYWRHRESLALLKAAVPNASPMAFLWNYRERDYKVKYLRRRGCGREIGAFQLRKFGLGARLR